MTEIIDPKEQYAALERFKNLITGLKTDPDIGGLGTLRQVDEAKLTNDELVVWEKFVQALRQRKQVLEAYRATNDPAKTDEQLTTQLQEMQELNAEINGNLKNVEQLSDKSRVNFYAWLKSKIGTDGITFCQDYLQRNVAVPASDLEDILQSILVQLQAIDKN